MKEEKNKNEELQSRREFFKSAAKAALPVLGAVVLSSLPIQAQAVEMGCDYYCYNSCTNGCQSGCKGGCYSGCDNGCRQSCYTGCRNTCDGTCSGGCARSAYA